jgi:hypothetical protein
MIDRYCLFVALFAAFCSGLNAADLIIRFDEDVSRLSVRLYKKNPSAAKVGSLDDQADPNPATYPNISDQGRVATFPNVPSGSWWVTIEDSESSWDRNYIDVKKIDKLDSNQQIEWNIPNGFIDVTFRGKSSHVIVKLERRIGEQLDEVFQKWLILENDEANFFSGKFTHVGEGVHMASFFEYSVDKGIGSFICSCSATQGVDRTPTVGDGSSPKHPNHERQK